MLQLNIILFLEQGPSLIEVSFRNDNVSQLNQDNLIKNYTLI